MRTGRPLLLSASGRFPAGTYDRDGSLHVAWVEPGAGHLWTVRYARFPGSTIPQDTIRANTISIGVIRLEETSAIDGLVIAADETHVYCVWSLIQTGAGTVRGTLGGLVFALSDPGATRNLRLDPDGFPGITADVAAHLSLRWPIIVGGEKVRMSVSASAPKAPSAWRDRPLVLGLRPEGVASLQQVTEGEAGVLGQTNLAVDDQGKRHLVWVTDDGSGSATVVYANTPRP